MRGKRLNRQLKRTFGDECIETRLKDLRERLADPSNADARQTAIDFIDSFPELLDGVEEAYVQLEEKAELAQRSLEVSAGELTNANKSLFSLNQTFDAMVNSLGQGFFIFGRDGICWNVHSKACETLLERSPKGLPVSKALAVPTEEIEGFDGWRELLFDELVEFDDLVQEGPQMYLHTKGLVVTLEYKPIRDAEGKLDAVVVIATDRTSEHQAKKEAYKMHTFATIVVNILKDKRRFKSFVDVSRQLFREAQGILEDLTLSNEKLDELRRQLHTLKGASGSFGMLVVKDLIHEVETQISLQYDMDLIHALLSKAIPEVEACFEGILDEHKDILVEALKDSDRTREIPVKTLHELNSSLQRIGPLVEPVRKKLVEEIIAIPIAKVLSQFNPPLHQTAIRLGKKISDIEFTGEKVSVIPDAYEAGLLPAMVHLFRNIADHGIETEAVRLQRGKPAEGKVKIDVKLVASRTGPMLRLAISDDGNGIDPAKIREKLKGSGKPVDGLSDQELIDKVFEPGFSTARQVSEFSGRGVGLDAVRAEVERIGGTIAVSSIVGKGTTFTLSVPAYLDVPESHSAPTQAAA